MKNLTIFGTASLALIIAAVSLQPASARVRHFHRAHVGHRHSSYTAQPARGDVGSDVAGIALGLIGAGIPGAVVSNGYGYGGYGYRAAGYGGSGRGYYRPGYGYVAY